MKINKIPIGQLAMEFLSVVFAVLLALGLNAYKESLDTKSQAELIKKSILTECRNNQIKIDSTMERNHAFNAYIDSLVHLESEDVTNVSFQYAFELLNHSAWNLALNNTATNYLDQDFMLAAADIYHTQEFYTDFTSSFYQNLAEHITRMDEVAPYNTALSFYYSLEVMNSTADDLKKKYESFFSNFEEQEE